MLFFFFEFCFYRTGPAAQAYYVNAICVQRRLIIFILPVPPNYNRYAVGTKCVFKTG